MAHMKKGKSFILAVWVENSSSVRSPFFQFNEILNSDFNATIRLRENVVPSGITLFGM